MSFKENQALIVESQFTDKVGSTLAALTLMASFGGAYVKPAFAEGVKPPAVAGVTPKGSETGGGTQEINADVILQRLAVGEVDQSQIDRLSKQAERLAQQINATPAKLRPPVEHFSLIGDTITDSGDFVIVPGAERPNGKPGEIDIFVPKGFDTADGDKDFSAKNPKVWFRVPFEPGMDFGNVEGGSRIYETFRKVSTVIAGGQEPYTAITARFNTVNGKWENVPIAPKKEEKSVEANFGPDSNFAIVYKDSVGTHPDFRPGEYMAASSRMGKPGELAGIITTFVIAAEPRRVVLDDGFAEWRVGAAIPRRDSSGAQVVANNVPVWDVAEVVVWKEGRNGMPLVNAMCYSVKNGMESSEEEIGRSDTKANQILFGLTDDAGEANNNADRVREQALAPFYNKGRLVATVLLWEMYSLKQPIAENPRSVESYAYFDSFNSRAGKNAKWHAGIIPDIRDDKFVTGPFVKDLPVAYLNQALFLDKQP